MTASDPQATAPAPFPVEEYRERVARTRREMAERGLAVLIATDPANINYLTGYDGYSFYVHQAVVVARDREWPLWIGRGQDVNGAMFTSVLPRDHLLGYPDEYVHARDRHPMKFVCARLREHDLHHGPIGVDADNFFFTGRDLDILRAESDAQVMDTGLLLNWIRSIKSAREIECIQQAARISELTMRRALDMIEPGVRQCDVAAEILRTQVSGTVDFGGDYPAIMPLMPTGRTTTCPHVTWRDAPFRADTASVVEISGVRHHYHAPLTRTLYLGTPPDDMARAADVIVEGINQALAAAAPGAEARDIHAAWNRVINRHGLYKDSRCGYSIGLGYPPDWGEGTISLRASDATVLEPNMTLHFMPGVWMQDWGISISETIRITAHGAEALCDFPRRLFRA